MSDEKKQGDSQVQESNQNVKPDPRLYNETASALEPHLKREEKLDSEKE